MLSFGFALSRQVDVFIWGCEGPQRAKGHFEDYEEVTNCTTLLIVLCLWEGGVFLMFL